MEYYKKNIEVISIIKKDGTYVPLSISTGNNHYDIDRIIEVRQANSQVGGSGLMYRIIIQDQERRIFVKQNRWWIESTKP